MICQGHQGHVLWLYLLLDEVKILAMGVKSLLEGLLLLRCPSIRAWQEKAAGKRIPLDIEMDPTGSQNEVGAIHHSHAYMSAPSESNEDKAGKFPGGKSAANKES